MPTVAYKEILDLKYNLAPSQLTILDIPNKNTFLVKRLLDRPLKYSDNGNEIGSINYILQSTHHFIRAKALQEDCFLPIINNETAIAIRPQVFAPFDLKEGDLLISKDSNIGEAVILDKDYPYHTLSGALFRLPVSKNKYYLFAFLKHSYFRKQLDLLVPKGSTIRHAKTLFLDCKIPFPSQKDADKVVTYVEQLTRAIINKEKEIRRKNKLINELIDKELTDNQAKGEFNYENPTFGEVSSCGRIDTGLYTSIFKQNSFKVKNYKNGSINLLKRGFKFARGTSLEIKGIGTRVDSDQYKQGFYELVIPANISEFGTVLKSTYIGTPSALKTIKNGDIVFGGEGFKKGRSFVVCDESSNIATNYHGIRIFKEKPNLTESIFVRCFLSYWREKGMIDRIGVGGSGGHCAPQYFHLIETPLFPELKVREIASLYYNPVDYPTMGDANSFLHTDQAWNHNAGIIEIDKSMKQLKERLRQTLDNIVSDQAVETHYSF